MSKYTTGEMAKLCGVTVRTVQYYDSRKILVPSELSEGGWRLYAEADLKKLKMICFLREMGLSINSITSILAEENSSNVITLLLEEQSRTLRQEIAEREARLHTVEQFAQEIKTCSSYSVEAIHDIAYTMVNRKKLSRVHLIMLALGIVMDVIEVVALFYAVAKGVWLPFIIGMPVVLLCGVGVIWLYYQKTAYICPQCHAVFRPKLREFLFSAHTPRTRRLTCGECGYKGFCVETYAPAKKPVAETEDAFK